MYVSVITYLILTCSKDNIFFKNINKGFIQK